METDEENIDESINISMFDTKNYKNSNGYKKDIDDSIKDKNNNLGEYDKYISTKDYENRLNKKIKDYPLINKPWNIPLDKQSEQDVFVSKIKKNV